MGNSRLQRKNSKLYARRRNRLFSSPYTASGNALSALPGPSGKTPQGILGCAFPALEPGILKPNPIVDFLILKSSFPVPLTRSLEKTEAGISLLSLRFSF
jgi:hypothetical protein